MSSSWPGKYDTLRGKQTRKRMINKLIFDHGGKMKVETLEKYLKAQGYFFLIEKLEAMGLFVDVDGYVHSTRR